MTRLGNQEPTFQTPVSYVSSDAAEAIDVMRDFGIELIPAQERELELYRAVDEDGRAACKTICISKPRQNGKSHAARVDVAITAAVDGKHVLYSAHHGITTRKMFKLLKDLFTETELGDELKPGNEGICNQKGSEGFYFETGGYIEFQTRTASGGRGGTYDVIVFDEAQELTEEELEAVKPTTIASESGDPQKIFLGTPPGPKCRGTVLKSYHDKAHEDPSGCGFWWLEWSVEELPDMTDAEAVLELAYLTNPLMGYRIREDVMMDEIKTATSVDGFAREYLGWWSKAASRSVITEAKWKAALVDRPERKGLTCYAVKFDAQGRRGTLSACIKQPDGTFYVVAIDSRSTSGGIGHFADWLVRHRNTAAQIVVDGKSHSEALLTRLKAEKIPKKVLVEPSGADVSNACAMFLNSINEGMVSHTAQEALDHSAMNTCRRPVGRNGGWAFEPIGEADATLIESCALAYWQCSTTRRNPDRKMRIG